MSAGETVGDLAGAVRGGVVHDEDVGRGIELVADRADDRL